ncbi:MAG TPA: MFS transporter [Bacilli bacterium]|nr:MFS transporter [Bacilli bacterium]
MKKELKLNYARTFYIGFAFFAILLIWQLYNHYSPLYLDALLKAKLTNEDHRWYIIGIIMAMDNLFALFMLPLFGYLSDKTRTKYGKRIPYIVIGMILSILVFPLISVAYLLSSLWGVILAMGAVLIIMNIYRSPAVALMPDVTPKPLRSKANGIINLVGYLGAILGGGISMIFKFTDQNKNYIVPSLIGSALMFIALVILIFKINENKILEETALDMQIGEELSETTEKIEENKPLSKADKRNLIILLVATFLWFASFNAVETFLSVYSKNVFGDSSVAGTAVIILTFSSIITFIPAGILSTKIGRKNTVIIGLLTIILAVVILIFQTKFNIIAIIAFALAGIGWASINVNSYPMLVEMTHQANIGRYTGLYYTSSMAAQSLTPIVAGAVMTFFSGPEPLFKYSTIVMVLALLVFIFFKTPKKQLQAKKGLEAFDVE